MRIIATLTFVLLCVGSAAAEECRKSTITHSKEFEKVKALEGRWEGTMLEGEKSDPVTVTYRTTSGGSAVVETISPGTPHEMVSVYHDEKGGLTMTHYCMLGNQPKLSVRGSRPNGFALTFAQGNTIDPATEDHMHSLEFVFIDERTMVQKWGSMQGGKERDAKTIFKLSRAE